MTTLFRRPRPELAPFVRGLWYAAEAGAPERERVLPTGSMQLVVNLADDVVHWYDGNDLTVAHAVGGAAVCGPVTHAVGIDTADRLAGAGVAFRPGGAAPFFAPPVGALAQPVIALDALWGTGAASLRERLLSRPTPSATLDELENILLERVVGPLEPDHAMLRAVRALDHGSSVAATADALGIGTSTLHRRFRAAVGPAPKAFGRVRRLQRVLRGARTGDGVDWAGLAVRHGYADQAHLIHDFRDITGITPRHYRPRSAGEHNHVPLRAG